MGTRLCQKNKARNLILPRAKHVIVKHQHWTLAGGTYMFIKESDIRKHFNTFEILSAVAANGYCDHLTTASESEVLPQADVPTDHRDGIVPTVHCHGEVERSDDADQAYRIPLFNERVARS